MKGIIILSLLAVIATGQAQVILLEETEINYSPRAVVHSSSPGQLVMSISQEHTAQFTNDPIRFMIENFKIQPFIASQNGKFDIYNVSFKTSNGYLFAEFNGNGELVKTLQRFKNGKMPTALKKEIYLDNKGWEIAGYKYVATGQKDRIDNEFYRVRIVNGKNSKTLKIRPERQLRIASN